MRMRVKLVIEGIERMSLSGGSSPTTLAEHVLGEVSEDRVAIVAHVYAPGPFAEAFVRVAGDALIDVAREKLTALLAEVGGSLGMRLKTWSEKAAIADVGAGE